MSAKHCIAIWAGVLLALSIACGGLGGSSSHHSQEPYGLFGNSGHPKDDHSSSSKKSKDDHSGVSKKTKNKRTSMESDDEKPLPNTVVVGQTNYNGRIYKLYRPAEGYVWAGTNNRSQRTYDQVTPVVPANKK